MNRRMIDTLIVTSSTLGRFSKGHYAWTGSACLVGNAILECQNYGLITLNQKVTNETAIQILADVLAVPTQILEVAEFVFEQLPESQYREFPKEFWKLLQVSTDWSQIPRLICLGIAEHQFKTLKDKTLILMAQSLIEYFSLKSMSSPENLFTLKANALFADYMVLHSLTDDKPNLRSSVFWLKEAGKFDVLRGILESALVA